MKYKTLIAVLKCAALVLSIVTVGYFYSNDVQLFNQNIVSYSQRFLTGKYVINFMALHILLESLSVINLFSYYATKYTLLNYVLGIISIAISLPLFYDFFDDYVYYDGDVSPLKFAYPLLYLLCGIFDFVIAGKHAEG